MNKSVDKRTTQPMSSKGGQGQEEGNLDPIMAYKN